MMVEERSLVRLVAVQHLRTAYGIKTKNWNKNKAASCKSTATTNSTKVFGVPLESLPYYNMARGRVPSFLVDACMKLQAHVDTEGLFRKSGSVVRLKGLRTKVDSGEECLSAAFPCDVAGLVKQFFRDLPEPVLPTELQEAFLKAQQLPTKEERTSATMLLSCVLPDRSLSVLCHFFDFLQNVSKRSAENKMDSANLSVILAPNLLHCGEGTEKMNTNTEKRIRLQTAVVHCFIEHAHNFGALPPFLEEKVSAVMHRDPAILSPAFNELQEVDQNSGKRRRHRHSLGVFSSATPVIVTPSSKRKLPLDAGPSFGFSNKKRRSVKKNLGMELLPSSLFSGTSTPGSAYSASGVLDSPQSTLSSAGKSLRQSDTSARRKSRRLSSRHVVSRVESGRAGCFSPKVDKKEAPHKSLRQRFSLGRSYKDAGSGSIGWRLASQESTTSFCFTKETTFSPSLLPRIAQSNSSNFISKSEDNLLSPQCEPGAHRTSWSGEARGGSQLFSGGPFPDTPMSVHLKNHCMSEPAIVVSKPPTGSSLPQKLCCASSAESLESESSISKASSQTVASAPKVENALGTLTHETMKAEPSDSILLPLPQIRTVARLTEGTRMSKFPSHHALNITFDIEALSPLHIDSIVLNSSGSCSPVLRAVGHNSFAMSGSDDSAEQVHCSRLIEALDMQSPAHFRLGVSPGLGSTPYMPRLELADELSTAGIGKAHCKDVSSPESGTQMQHQQPHNPECHQPRVADHIQHFNKLTLKSPKGVKAKHVRSPLKFQRTPVRQAVRRINSIHGESRLPSRNLDMAHAQGIKAVKAVSLESGLSPHPQPQPPKGDSRLVLNRAWPFKKPPPVPPKKPNTLAAKSKAFALGDVTNKVQTRTNVDSSISDAAGAQEVFLPQLAENEARHYRGSPRNPLTRPRLLPATKPVDL
ncbi:LOW QUALITY PROTEIN: rho GTPase-activating protein 11A-like [Phycodurus eques]|uniref:LOW QUALITY PROTEIN: rho GTPase-activating protein 11A-like n=1 Tax=Phycodurus eques TaxID=693459 RepID=UPI002ACED5AE|nr:LOW QUALITY PROTEIN: rho GTPase-activating protein 11A-like [Phycodurus eques]